MLPGPFPLYTPGGGYGIQGSPSVGWFFPGNGYVGIGGPPAAKLDIIGSSNTGSAQQAIRFTDTGSTAAQRDWALGNSIGANYGEFCIYASAAKNGNPLSGGVLVLTLKPDGSTDTAGTIRATGAAAPTGGAGAEMSYAGGTATFTGINRGTAALTSVVLDGNATYIRYNGAERIVADANGVTLYSPQYFRQYTVATLPSAAIAGGAVYVSDASGSPCLAISNGTNWKRSDNAATTVS